MRSYKITANLMNKNNIADKTFQQYDYGNKIEFELLEGAQKIDLTGKTILTYWLKNGSTVPIEKSATVNSNGNIEVKTTQELLEASGELLMQILVSSNDEQARSQVFKFNVEKSLNGDNAIIEDPNYSSDLVTELIQLRDSVRAETIGKIEEVGLKLDNTTEEINSKMNILNKNTRIFHPNFGVNFYLGQADNLTGKVTVKTLEKCKSTIEPMLPYLDEIPIVFHISYNENTSKYYIVEPISTMKPLVEWIQTNGVNVPAVKMYAQRFTISNATSVYGTIEDFHREWKKIMIEIAEAFKDLNITYFSVHNEVNEVCGDTNHLPYVLDEISTLKSYGYKVAYNYSGALSYYNTLKEVKDQLDAHFVNYYPIGSCNGVNTTQDDVLNAIYTEETKNIISTISNDYPKADIIINEVGVQDNWNALSRPAKFEWINVVASNGVAPNYYLTAMLETFKNENIKSVWWWYNLNFSITKKTLKEYLNK